MRGKGFVWERLSASIIAAGKPLPPREQICNPKKAI
jgi:hypothetical protein